MADLFCIALLRNYGFCSWESGKSFRPEEPVARLLWFVSSCACGLASTTNVRGHCGLHTLNHIMQFLAEDLMQEEAAEDQERRRRRSRRCPRSRPSAEQGGYPGVLRAGAQGHQHAGQAQAEEDVPELAVRYDELAPAASKPQRKKMEAVWKTLEEAMEA